ncbi:unnamed protein product [Lupinus luteus]|uniref:Metallothionein n=1 Tax=Lupinus luteus TaxID=3873 RepID=A0AAV1Y2H4_LUPLU
MADTGRVEVRRRVVVCDNNCGCTVPCSGDSSCRCTSGESTTDHSTCSCGEHCECNPCSCPKTTAAAGTGCKCASGCTCASCRI